MIKPWFWLDRRMREANTAVEWGKPVKPRVQHDWKDPNFERIFGGWRRPSSMSDNSNVRHRWVSLGVLCRAIVFKKCNWPASWSNKKWLFGNLKKGSEFRLWIAYIFSSIVEEWDSCVAYRCWPRVDILFAWLYIHYRPSEIISAQLSSSHAPASAIHNEHLVFQTNLPLVTSG